MASDLLANRPDVALSASGDVKRLSLTGDWTLAASRGLERAGKSILAKGGKAGSVVIDMSAVARLDTAGALLLNRARETLTRAGAAVAFEGTRAEQRLLLDETAFAAVAPARAAPGFLIVDLLADLGASVVNAAREFYRGTGFLGEFVVALGRTMLAPRLFRGTSLVYQMEMFGLRSIPIILLINLAVGSIVAQQGIFQLMRFGATSYSVDLIGILVLRELGVLLTSIMIAGRSGSAITAELGSMKMREEVDALRVMGLSPIEVLVVPRVLALAVSLPLLTVIADMAALFGGLLVSWGYAGISPAAFISLLQEAIGVNTFMVGIIKAPFMALVIGVISTQDGLATMGSAESLGRQVTAAVVKSIFMVIIVDGLFAMFFASISY
ncbi:ABC transporter permease [Methylocystis heyeri]|uniref:MlaE family lipid ABC transporter permease subunit n=1 Tax=Methylocystis heyeri TaxID=391905 RepID=A0A6B8KF45_9HYPH|nr:MlaE family lipid ABC transporter permease subunit [Methylocystis heyeri]QGM46916.1 MlaE family lipid ABC transporter permease subunit [Methylocystis heyeri]